MVYFLKLTLSHMLEPQYVVSVRLVGKWLMYGLLANVDIFICLKLEGLYGFLAYFVFQEMENSSKNNFLIDGFPRNKDNLDGWNKEMSGIAKVKQVLFFDCPDEVKEQILWVQFYVSSDVSKTVKFIMYLFSKISLFIKLYTLLPKSSDQIIGMLLLVISI